MAAIFRKRIVQYWVFDSWFGPDGLPCPEGTPGARYSAARKVPKGTPGAQRKRIKSKKWYGRIPGQRKDIPLSANKSAAQMILGEMVKRAELGRAGVVDPYA